MEATTRDNKQVQQAAGSRQTNTKGWCCVSKRTQVRSTQKERDDPKKNATVVAVRGGEN